MEGAGVNSNPPPSANSSGRPFPPLSAESSITLTVLTATKNAVSSGRADTLRQAIESVDALKLPHEHLVLDGGSEDGTRKLLKSLSASTPSLRVTSEPDTGLYAALNRALPLCRGEWLYVLGDDDLILYPERLDGLLAHPPAGCEMIAASVLIGEKRLWPVRPRLTLHAMPHPHQGILMRTALIRRLGGFDERFRIAADYDLTLRAHLAGTRCAIVDLPFARFALTGRSERQIETVSREIAESAVRRLGLDERFIGLHVRERRLPIRAMLKLLAHPSAFIRAGARHQLLRGMARHLGLLNGNGMPRLNLRCARP